MTAFARRRGVVRRGAFNPLTSIPWAHAYWTEGPEFAALGLANGATVTSWPDEIGTADMAATAGTLLYRAAAAAVGGRPAIEAFGTEAMNAVITSIPQPWTVVAVGNRVSGSGYMFGANGTGAANGGLSNATFNAGVANAYPALQTGVFMLSGHANGAASEVWRGTTSIDTGDSGATAIALARAFARTSAAVTPWVGHLTFCAVIGRALTTQERADLAAFFATLNGTT